MRTVLILGSVFMTFSIIRSWNSERLHPTISWEVTVLAKVGTSLGCLACFWLLGIRPAFNCDAVVRILRKLKHRPQLLEVTVAIACCLLAAAGASSSGMQMSEVSLKLGELQQPLEAGALMQK